MIFVPFVLLVSPVRFVLLINFTSFDKKVALFRERGGCKLRIKKNLTDKSFVVGSKMYLIRCDLINRT